MVSGDFHSPLTCPKGSPRSFDGTGQNHHKKCEFELKRRGIRKILCGQYGLVSLSYLPEAALCFLQVCAMHGLVGKRIHLVPPHVPSDVAGPQPLKDRAPKPVKAKLQSFWATWVSVLESKGLYPHAPRSSSMLVAGACFRAAERAWHSARIRRILYTILNTADTTDQCRRGNMSACSCITHSRLTLLLVTNRPLAGKLQTTPT